MSKGPSFTEMGTAKTVGIANLDQKQLIDLDEVYEEGTSEEEVNAMAEYLKTGKLSKNAVGKEVAGTERFEPGCTTLNGRLGGESFLTSMVSRGKDFVAKIIKYIKEGIKWLLVHARNFTNFFSDNREIVKSDELLNDIEDKLAQLGGAKRDAINVEELFGDEPASARRLAIVRLLRARNASTLEAVARLNTSAPAIKDLILELSRQEQNVGKVKDRFGKHVAMLKRRLKEKSLTREDIVRWEAETADLMAQNLQNHRLKQLYVKLAKLVSDVDVPGMSESQQFKASQDMLSQVMQATKDEVSVQDFAQLAVHGANLRKAIEDDPGSFDIKLDMGDVKKLEDLVRIDDLELFKAIGDELGDQRPAAVYQNFVAVCAGYLDTIRACLETAVRYSNEVRYVSEWSQRYDLILMAYSLKSTEERNQFRQKHYDETGEKLNTAKLGEVPEDGLDKNTRYMHNLYSKLFPGLKKTMNGLSRKLNAGVQVQ